VLFKRFADVDVFDIELNCTTAEEIIAAVKAIAPTFGGINLEDIKAPEAFVIETRLKEELDIPVFHDDQHGTAIISGAALMNACRGRGQEAGRYEGGHFRRGRERHRHRRVLYQDWESSAPTF
jgi:malate dehydrogenase (oxaloacetate-decarboxylating)(NADP+)